MKHMRPETRRELRAGWMATVALAALLAAGMPVVAAAHGESGGSDFDPGCPYVVQFGDTLASIAQRGGVTIGEVMEVNGIHNPDLIYVGQVLLVPCESQGQSGGQGGYPQPMPYDDGQGGGHDDGHGGGDQGGGPQPEPYYDYGAQGGQGSQGGYQEPMPQGGQSGGQSGQGGYQEPTPQGGGQGGYQEPMPQGGQSGQGGYQEPMPQSGQGGYQEPMPQGGEGGQGGYQEPMPQGGEGGQGGYQEPMPQGGDDHGGGHDGGQGGYQEPMPQGGDDHGGSHDGGNGPDGHDDHGGSDGHDGHGGHDWDSHPDMDFWHGAYYKDKYFSEFVEDRQDPEVRFNWYTGSPGPNIPNDRFSIRWDRILTLPGGNYKFFATADDGVRVIVDDVTVIDAWKIQPATDYEGTIFLNPGKHKIVVEYYEEAEDAQVSVHWKQLGH